ncbi:MULTISPECIES: SNF2-related protein [unclassified Spirosoma]|uniref:SNF2-related protein n=1 Tax=unclassified Spirosoma TaxID=2621999 RepID=UPI000965D5A0|nr:MULTISPECIES: SNF2-related protein [unclassified Spirosoma]MBN8824980.1 DEAD/DEAH box helicase family protein [Spirosoma sp.]OJW73275.1 MAG: helicase SNF2 [Spirosoma sp. 48-14]
MAERIAYGKTWWGQKWLNALASIDMANRLPRGKSYANKGAVMGLLISTNQISASVKGTAPRPYKIKLSVPLFTEQERTWLLTEIRENPATLAQLLNRQLPPELTEFVNRRGIQLFPASFRDLSMGCSCPDLAVPCKHVAAVVYIIANEIDRNPFLVFQLKGLDILEELQKDQVDVGGSMSQVLSFKDICTDELPDDEDWQPSEAARTHLDYATIPALSEQLLGLLSPDVTFTKGDFHKSLTRAYKLFSKPLSDEKPLPPDERPDFSDSIELQLDEVMSVKKINIFSEHGEPRPLSGFKMSDLVGWINTLTEADWPEMSDSVRALYLTHQFSAALLRRGAIVPQLLRVTPGEDQYRVRWIPAMLNEFVKQQTELLASQIPPTLLTVRWQKEWLALPGEQLVLTLCSLFLRRVIKPTTIELWERWPLEDADRLFFGIETLRFEGFGRKEMPLAIQLWLNDFFLTHKRFVPIVAVEDNDTPFGDEFRLSLLIRDRESKTAKGTLDPPIPLPDLLTKKKHQGIRMAVLQDLLVLSRHFPDLARLTKMGGPAYLTYSPSLFVDVLLETLPRMQLLGISLWLPKSLQHWVRPQAGGRLKAKVTANNAFMRLDDMLTFDWQVALGEEMISVNEFQRLVGHTTGLVKIKDQYVLIDPNELTKLYKQLENPPELTGSDLLKAALAEEYKGGRLGLSAEVRTLVKQFTESASQPLPDALNATLRPYQQRGYDWLMKNTSLGMGSLLADDMGLGKTLQIIALLLKFKQEGRFKKQKGLVVLPTTLLTNWQKEIARFAPDLRPLIYHGSSRKLPDDKTKDYDLLLTTYGVVRSDLDKLKKTNWAVVIIDEAQNIKNSDTEQTKAVKALKAPIRIALSGTPIENRLSEFWSIMDFVNKGYLGGVGKFNEEFGKPIQQERDHQKLDQFRRIASPFLLRRVKTDRSIISDLPDKIENNQFCTLTTEQAALYESVVQESLRAIQQKDGIARRGLVLKLMTALKQIGNHPRQYLKQGADTPALSGKTTLLLNLLENIYASHEKVLIFTQYQEMGQLLVQFIQQAFGTPPLFLHGGTSRDERDRMVEQFQKNRSDHTFILSLKAGGTGLNLTQANHVIHYDLWWNPAVESQATDRAFRIGQTKNVLVYRLINQGTMEEKIDAMIRNKKELADLSIKTGETWLGDLSDTELKELVTLG